VEKAKRVKQNGHQGELTGRHPKKPSTKMDPRNNKNEKVSQKKKTTRTKDKHEIGEPNGGSTSEQEEGGTLQLT